MTGGAFAWTTCIMWLVQVVLLLILLVSVESGFCSPFCLDGSAAVPNLQLSQCDWYEEKTCCNMRRKIDLVEQNLEQSLSSFEQCGELKGGCRDELVLLGCMPCSSEVASFTNTSTSISTICLRYAERLYGACEFEVFNDQGICVVVSEFYPTLEEFVEEELNMTLGGANNCFNDGSILCTHSARFLLLSMLMFVFAF